MGFLVNLGSRFFGVNKIVAEAEDCKTAAGGVLSILAGIAGVLTAIVGMGQELIACHDANCYLTFFTHITKDPYWAALLASAYAVSSGWAKVGAANHQAAVGAALPAPVVTPPAQ